MSQNLGLFAHLAGVIVWVGGMALLYLCLRPASLALPPAQRLPLWVGVLSRFFPLVWTSIALIVVSGFGKLGHVGFASAPVAWHVMMATGLVMIAVFASIWYGPWPKLRRAAADGAWAAGAVALSRSRQRVAFSLCLGVFTAAVATLGLALL